MLTIEHDFSTRQKDSFLERGPRKERRQRIRHESGPSLISAVLCGQSSDRVAVSL